MKSQLSEGLEDSDLDYYAFGAFDVFAEERKSWREILDYAQTLTNVVFHNIPQYGDLNQKDQHIRIFQEPTRIAESPKPLFTMWPVVYLGGDVDDYDKLPWSPQSNFCPEKNDVILEINGIPVNGDDFINLDYRNHFDGDIKNAKKKRVDTLVKDSPDLLVMRLKDRKTNKNYYFRAKLLPKGSASRLGLNPGIDEDGNLVVESVEPDSPAQKGQFAKDDGDGDGYNKLPWSPQAIYYPEKGDQILEINGTPVNGSERHEFDFDGPYDGSDIRNAKKNRVYALIKRSPDTAVLKLKDHKTGKNYYFRTKLNPKGSGTRFGLYPEIDAEGNLVAGATVPGSPATRGQFAWE